MHILYLVPKTQLTRTTYNLLFDLQDHNQIVFFFAKKLNLNLCGYLSLITYLLIAPKKIMDFVSKIAVRVYSGGYGTKTYK